MITASYTMFSIIQLSRHKFKNDMGGFDYYLETYRKYFDFDGRARRSEYWYFVLYHILVSIFLIFGLVFLIRGAVIIVFLIYALFTFIPNLALMVRRLHDTNRNGAYLLLHFIPFGSLVLFVFMLQEGTHGPNKFGEDPKMMYDEDSYI